MKRKADQSARDLSILNQVAIAAAAAVDLDGLLEYAAQVITGRLDTGHLGFALLDAEADVLRIHPVSRGMPPEWLQAAIPLNQGIIGEVARTGQPLLLADTQADPRYIEVAPAMRSEAAVPLRAGERVLGVLNVESPLPAAFDDYDVEFLSMLASQIAAAIERTRLSAAEQRRRQRAEALAEISATLATTLDLDLGLEMALAQLEKLIAYDYASIALFEDGLAHIRASRGFADTSRVTEAVSIDQLKTLSHLAVTKQALLIPDTADSPLWRPDVLGGAPIRCWIGAPLIVRDMVIGALMVDNRRPHVYAPDDRDAVAALANYLAAAIDNARLHAQNLRQVRELTALYETSLDVTSRLEPQVLLEVVVQRAAALLHARGGGLYLYDPAADQLRLSVGYNLGRDYTGGVLKPGEGLSGQALVSGRPEAVDNYSVWEGRPLVFHHAPFTAVLAIPLHWQDANVGVLFIADDSQGRRFSQEEIELASRLASQAAIAIGNLQLYTAAQQRAEQLRLVNQIGQHITSILDPVQLSAEVARRICETFNYYAVSVHLVEGDMIRLSAGVVRSPAIERMMWDRPLGIGQEGIIGWVAATGKPLHVADVEADSRYLAIPELPLTRSELAVPLLLGGQVNGVLDVESDRVGAFDQTDLETMQALAGQLSIAITNARLFEAVRAHAAELERRVTERTAEIRAQQERTEAILRSVADAVIVTDLQGQIVLTNATGENLLMTEHGPLSALTELVHKLATDPDPSRVETVEQDGLVLQAHAARVMEDGQALGTVITLRDITRLRELDRLKSQFVSNVSHELRTPLSNIKLYLSLLSKGRPEKREGYLGVLEREVARLERLIQSVLDLSRLDMRTEAALARQPEPVSLDQVIASVLEAQHVSAEARRLTIRYTPDPQIPPVSADRNQLIQVFTNLISNAILYTPEGGQIEVATNLHPYQEKLHMVVTIRDTGIGIAPEEIDRIFDRFYRSPRPEVTSAPGTGLGLAIVKEIVDLHHGRVEVTSEVGAGSTFTVWLPISGP